MVLNAFQNVGTRLILCYGVERHQATLFAIPPCNSICSTGDNYDYDDDDADADAEPKINVYISRMIFVCFSVFNHFGRKLSKSKRKRKLKPTY